MKAPFSPYLAKLAPFFKRVIAKLGEHYDYVSLLSTDSKGLSCNISGRTKAVSTETPFTERGTVIRVHHKNLYVEYAFDALNLEEALSEDEKTRDEAASMLAGRVKTEVDWQLKMLERAHTEFYETPALPDEEREIFAEFDAEILPEEADVEKLLAIMTDVSERGKNALDEAVDCMVRATCTHVNKLFLSAKQDLRQSYCYADGSILLYVQSEDNFNVAYQSFSDRCGMEIYEHGYEKLLPECIRIAKELLKADRVEPGEYTVITTPGISGLIAHEAFGHGVEMDMFVKNRALGRDYINQRVGSDLVTMHEGALCADTCTGYAFDDEGTPAGDVIEIDHGILKTGICDALSALRLGVQPTGNGKRERFDHKVYTRMTNTVFDSGTDTLADMIASVDYGFLLDGTQSGMEDPKHWGIQCIVDRGYEIKDGKLTGRVISPVVMTGYVPDLLGSISMVSTDREVDGAGMCGKGYKEWVKVADGGPYLKAKARLG